MSIALASEWQLSDLLLESYGVNITNETKAVHLGRRISIASRQGWNSTQINKILKSQVIDLGFDILSGMDFMRDGAKEAQALAASYDQTTNEPCDDITQQQPEEAVDTFIELPAEPLPKKISNAKKPKPTTLIRP